MRGCGELVTGEAQPHESQVQAIPLMLRATGSCCPPPEPPRALEEAGLRRCWFPLAALSIRRMPSTARTATENLARLRLLLDVGHTADSAPV